MGQRLVINGEDREFGEWPGTVAELLAALEINAETVVAEVDGEIVERKDFATSPLADGQVVELVRFVVGG